MKFELTEGNRSFWGPDPPYQVERILEKDHRYLVACFRDREDAKAVLEIIKAKSVEAERGAEVHCG